ncbi:MAG: hypothetical protein U0797_15675 [Gemmataceae bacterium]
MSYELVFWKQSPGNPADPLPIYEQLMEGEQVAGLEKLPGDRILGRVAEMFKDGWVRLDELNWERSQGAFLVELGPQHFRVDCYGLPGEVVNLFIDIGAEFGAKLFDPQVGERFEG